MSEQKEMKKQIATLSHLSKQKGHLEAVRRIQLAFELELRDAGVKGEDVNQALAKLNAAIGFTEDKVSGEYEYLMFDIGAM